ncbi:MAG: D-xylose ABC transporter xylG, ATP-binding protein [Treponematales bacterium]
MVELRGIEKRFPDNGVEALSGAGFELAPGEIHAVVGENGAGKSTLMRVLAGFLKPDRGAVVVNGRERVFRSPADALKAGIGMVRQHPLLPAGLRVWEWCVLGAEGGALLSAGKAAARVREASERWGLGLPVEADAGALTVSQKQKAAVLSLLLRNADYLVFDEPTAVLTAGETDALFAVFRSLKEAGKAVALISHKLGETLALADRVTVVRGGRTFPARPASSFTEKSLAALLSEGEEPPRAAAETVLPAAAGPPVLRVENLTVDVPGRPLLSGVSLEVPAGGITGVAGVRDGGLETLELAIAGLLPCREGTVAVGGRDITGGGVRAFREAGGAWLGADRGSSLAGGLPLRESLIVHAFRRSRRGLPGKFGVMDGRFLADWTGAILRRAGVAGRPAASPVSAFSGGTLQRILLAREFAEDARLLVLAEPGWGLDSGSRGNLAAALREHAAQGGGALIFSTDTGELLSVCGDILVLRNGAFSARFPAAGEDSASLKAAIDRAMAG